MSLVLQVGPISIVFYHAILESIAVHVYQLSNIKSNKFLFSFLHNYDDVTGIVCCILLVK